MAESHQKALAAIDEGRFDNEILPIAQTEMDEGPRRDISMDRMRALNPLNH